MSMSKYGQKYICTVCVCKFFDLHRPKPVCPRCGTEPKILSRKELSKIDGPKSSARKETVSASIQISDTDLDLDDNLWDNIDDYSEEVDA
ncbi:FYDLN acid domain-containing protein [candidate division CSSED10-310 bacterium]|uniref:FYDLN acid domain-containing protein n=1 Tax=candidate division CSSED10-310 bacterium TaxID=2855610 RepID=A0ABV6YZQ3_UNCC1